MGNLTVAAIFVILLNVFMWLTQVSALELNPDGPVYYNCEGSIMNEFGNCEEAVIDTSNIEDQLPTAEGSISATTGNLFTDTFSSIKTWFGSRLSYAYAILAAPYNILKSLPGLPIEIVYAAGTLWYGVSLFILISFFWGRE